MDMDFIQYKCNQRGKDNLITLIFLIGDDELTLKEAEKKYILPHRKLEKYVSLGFFRKDEGADGVESYCDKDFEQLGLIDTLLSAGFTPEETKKYLVLTEKKGTDEQQILMLKKQRRELLDDIHKQQQLLDSLDFMIWDKKAKQEKIR